MTASRTGTRAGILETLKRTGDLTASQLAEQLNVTAMAARQHLAVLEAEGLVETSLRRSGVGRPSGVYRLTEKGHETFPRFYDDLVLSILKSVKALQGPAGLRIILERRADDISQAYGPQLRRLPPRDRLQALFEVLVKTGHLPEFEEGAEQVVITEYNCPIARVSREFPEICRSELRLMENLVDLPVKRDSCMAEKGPFCRYRFTIPSV